VYEYFEIEDGFLKAPELPGIGTRLKPDVMSRKDAHIRKSDVSKESLIDAWETLDTSGKRIKLRTEKMEREIQSLREHRGPIYK